MPSVKGWRWALWAVGLFVGAEAGAEEPFPPLLADMCAACHGPGGDSPGSVPSLDSLDEGVIRAFLLGFREGDIEATVMDRIARALSDPEIETLSQHFGGGAD